MYRTVLNLVVAVAFAAALTVPMLTNDAPVGGWVGSQAEVASQAPLEDVTPRWQPAYSERFAGCSARQGQASELVVVDMEAEAARVPFAVAWDRNHDADDANDVWVVGWCGRTLAP